MNCGSFIKSPQKLQLCSLIYHAQLQDCDHLILAEPRLPQNYDFATCLDTFQYQADIDIYDTFLMSGRFLYSEYLCPIQF